jgi:uncharacterized membrane protein
MNYVIAAWGISTAVLVLFILYSVYSLRESRRS